MAQLPNISRSKDNQTKNFSQLIEYNKRKFFYLKILQETRQEESYSVNWRNFVFWLCSLFEILSNTCIGIAFFLSHDVMNFEVNIFLITPFATWPKSQDKKLNILRTKTAFQMKQKAFSIVFKGLSVVLNLRICLYLFASKQVT